MKRANANHGRFAFVSKIFLGSDKIENKKTASFKE